MSKDYYKILGVEKNATKEDIKKAFRKKAHQYHPDKGTGDEAKFKEANEAYQVLSDENKRAQYDRFGSNFDQAGHGGGNPFGGAGGFDFSGFSGGQGFADVDIDEIFGDFFGGFGRRGGGGKQTVCGRDLELRVTVSFAEAALGVEKKVSLEKMTPCRTCDGSGAKPGTNPTTCSECKGSGRTTHVRQTFLGAMQTQSVCNTCNGEGSIITDTCTDCSGQGVRLQQTNVDITVPGGVQTGTQLRLAGAGEAGKRGAPAGDLYIRIEVEPHPQFTREGETIYSTVFVPFSTMLHGDKISVATVDGTVSLKIPAGTQSGKRFNLAGKGAKKLQGRGRGDQIVTVQVAVPNQLTREQKKVIKELSRLGL